MKDKNIFIFLIVSINIILYTVDYRSGVLFLGGASDSFSQEWYRYITSLFIHSNINHIISNMLNFVIFGIALSKYVNLLKFILIYFFGGIISNIISVYLYMIIYKNDIFQSIGASGAIYSIIGAFTCCVILNYKKYNFSNILIYIFFIIYNIYNNNFENINLVAHISGFIIGIILMIILYKEKEYV